MNTLTVEEMVTWAVNEEAWFLASDILRAADNGTLDEEAMEVFRGRMETLES